MTIFQTAAAPRPLLGILYMIAVASIFPVMNSITKLLSDTYPPEQLIWARTASHLAFALLLFGPGIGLRIFRSVRLKVQIGRSLIQFASNGSFIIALKFLPLAEATTLSFAAPFIVALMAVPILGEQLSRARLAAVAVGFVGVLVVIRPGGAVFHWASLLVLFSTICYAVYQILTRFVAGHDRPETSVVYSSLAGALVMSCVVPFHWVTPHSLLDAVMLAAIGVFGGLAHYCIARALFHAATNVVAPFHYWQLIGSAALGFLLFGDLPDVYTWLGAALIVGCGLFIGWRERGATEGRRPEPAVSPKD
ncbi:MAG: DMT family transporter [Alphaproteobacteria bacterium]|nr:DMT family transporter [Alphaproteobacteria bacterium]